MSSLVGNKFSTTQSSKSFSPPLTSLLIPSMTSFESGRLRFSSSMQEAIGSLRSEGDPISWAYT
eukprot:scaffold37763_cov139-Skeletonema_dohrnii-CCMP3373.AAC.1